MKYIKPLEESKGVDKVEEVLLYRDIPGDLLSDLLPKGSIDIINDKDKERVSKLKKQIKDMLNTFWKKNNIPRKIK